MNHNNFLRIFLFSSLLLLLGCISTNFQISIPSPHHFLNAEYSEYADISFNVVGEGNLSFTSLSVQPPSPNYEQQTRCKATVSTSDGAPNLSSVSFTLIKPDSSTIDLGNASTRSGNEWFSAYFLPNQAGVWNCSALAVDSAQNTERASVLFNVSAAPSPPGGGRQYPVPEPEQPSLSLAISAQCAKEFASISIMDNRGNSVSNAHVRILYQSWVWQSVFDGVAETGSLSFIPTRAGVYEVSAFYAGYPTATYQFKVLDCAAPPPTIPPGPTCTSASEFCSSDKECCSGLCSFMETCVSCRAQNETCISNSECCSSNCTNSKCILTANATGGVEPSPQIECNSDLECAQGKQCSNNKCEKVSCACGYISNHTCILYSCCFNKDCASEESCHLHECVNTKQLEQEKSEAAAEISSAYNAIADAKIAGISTISAEQTLVEAGQAFSYGDYSSAKRFATKAREQATLIMGAETPTSAEEKGAPDYTRYIIVALLIIFIILDVKYITDLLKRRGMR
ncbi:MAG: hypothetical protein ABIH99_05435 [Candidatus Micrarchaeota archaeon]